MAGGDRALIHSVEGAEDNFQAGENDLISINLRPEDREKQLARLAPRSKK